MSQAEKEMDKIAKKLRKISKDVVASGIAKDQWESIRDYIHTAIEMTTVAYPIAVERARKIKP